MEELSGTQLRDRLLAHNPLDRDWIARINQVTALVCKFLPFYMALIRHLSVKLLVVMCFLSGVCFACDGGIRRTYLREL